MPGSQPASVVHLTSRVRKLLKRLLRRQQLPRCLVWRIQIVLQAAKPAFDIEQACERRLHVNNRAI